MHNVIYQLAANGDLPEIRKLLTTCQLATDGIEHLVEQCIIARSGASLAGVVAWEKHEQAALMRSLAVSPDFRSHAIGRNLCGKLFSQAHLAGVEQLYLLTLDAEQYFSKLGFIRCERTQAPAQIQTTSQFRTLCPQTAICMSRNLAGEVIHATTDMLRLRPDVPGASMWAVALQHTMLTYFKVDPQSRFAPHSHESEQITMVLTGALYFEMQGKAYCIKPGEVIAIPSSVPHSAWTEEQPVTAIDAWSPVMRKYGSENS